MAVGEVGCEEVWREPVWPFYQKTGMPSEVLVQIKNCSKVHWQCWEFEFSYSFR